MSVFLFIEIISRNWEKIQLSHYFPLIEVALYTFLIFSIYSFIDCRVCLRRFHQVCVLYVTPLFPNGFTCQNCLNSQPDVPLELTQRKSARQLPHYDISSFIEERVHELLRQKECNEDVFIRLVSTGENTMELKPRIKERYSGVCLLATPLLAILLY